MMHPEEISQLKEQLSAALDQLKQMQESLSKSQERESQRLEQLSAVVAENRSLHEQLAEARKQIEDLEKAKTVPDFVKANVVKPPAGQKKERKKRDAKHNHGRRREAPKQVVEYPLTYCPVCTSRLGGINVARRRQVIELAPPPAVEVTEHVVYQGWCSQCHKWREAKLDVSADVIGHGRFGVKVASVIAYLRTVMRLPVRQVQAYLATLHGLQISNGEIVELMHRFSEQMKPTLAAIKQQIRGSPAVQADETGWREDGVNGYIWSACTSKLRYYEYHHSRGGEVIQQLLGEDFEGVLGSDFYAAYNIYEGLHQRCWVHLLRHIHELKTKFPQDEELLTWAKAVKALYVRAVSDTGPNPSLSAAKQEVARAKQQHAYERELMGLCAPYVRTAAPMHTLCERVERFLPELFVFVAIPGVPSDNNLAERSVRPLVIARKISGGSRSPKGSQTRMALFSLFGTWAAQEFNPFKRCLAALSLQHPLGQI